jgi:hypothetical protein
VARREPRARLHEAGVAERDRDREPGADERTLAGRQLDALAGGEVESGVAGVCARGHDCVVAQPLHRQLDHATT